MLIIKIIVSFGIVLMLWPVVARAVGRLFKPRGFSYKAGSGDYGKCARTADGIENKPELLISKLVKVVGG